MRILICFVCLVLPLSAGNIDAETLINWRGDANGDMELNISDAIYIDSFLLAGGPAPTCMRAADFNGSGHISLSDPIGILNYLFSSGAAPADPQEFTDCEL